MATVAKIAVLGATVALLAPSAAAATNERSRPPSVAEARRATHRFLERHGGDAPTARPSAAARVGEPVLPTNRVVALYGSPQMPLTAVGMRTPEGAAGKLAAQSEPYEQFGIRPVVGEIDLVSVLATAGAGPDRKYRMRQDPAVIDEYLTVARAVGARLMLDIQPGRSTFKAEVRALRDWILEPDVDIGLDPEWNVGRHGIPGRTAGRVTAKEVNQVVRSLSATVSEHGLPPKLLVVHQFRTGSIHGRAQVRARRGVQPVLNFDGIGGPRAKATGYAALSSATLFNGFSLFYRRDRTLMRPSAVLALEPEPDFLLYQ